MGKGQKVASLDAIEPGGVLGVDIGGKTIALYRLGDEVYATDGVCTHGLALLAEGFVDGDKIECPLHQGVFDIRTGKALSGPVTEDLRVYPVRIEGSDVLVDLEGAA